MNCSLDPPWPGYNRQESPTEAWSVPVLKTLGRHLIPQPLIRALQDRFVYRPVMRQKHFTTPEDPPLFDTVFFEVRTRCNGHCAFCAASVESDGRPDLSMPWEMHDKVVRELAAIGFAGRIAYHNNSEPLIFKELPRFVAHAKATLPTAQVQILSNGRALTIEKADALIRAGIDELTINYYNDDLTCPLPPVFHDVASLVLPKHFRPEEIEVVGVGADHVNPSARFKYHLRRRLENVRLTSRAGTAPNKPTPDPAPRGFCQFPWTQLIVSADGRAPMCCCDLNITEPVGDVSRQTVMEIWKGKPLRRIRGALLRGDRQAISTCRQCDFYGVKRPPSTLIGKYVFSITQ